MRKQQAPAAPSVTIDTIIDHVSRDKGIDRKVLIEAVEAAIQNAAHKALGADRQLEARYNQESGQVDLFQYMKVVEHVLDSFREVSLEEVKEAGLEADTGEELGFQIFYLEHERQRREEQEKKFGRLLRLGDRMMGFGRIAAQTARQVINHRIRDAEREIIFREYKDRKAELVTGIVRRYEKGAIIVDLGRAEAILDPSEQVPRESYRIGDRVQAYVKDVDREAKGPPIRLSRADIGLLIKLFEQEVPEIYEGIVRIVSAAREPGSRSKIAVASRDADVDPVGACVGMKGSRVQAVVQVGRDALAFALLYRQQQAGDDALLGLRLATFFLRYPACVRLSAGVGAMDDVRGERQFRYCRLSRMDQLPHVLDVHGSPLLHFGSRLQAGDA